MFDPEVLSEDDKALLRPLYERLTALKARKNRVEHWAPNKRYVIDIVVANDEIPILPVAYNYVTNTEFFFTEGQTNIDHGKIFLCEEIECIVSAAGTSVTTDAPATFVLQPPWRSEFLDFYLKGRDTGSDREWFSDWVPGNAFASANLGGLTLGDEAHILISGGASAIMSLQVVRNFADVAEEESGLTDIKSYQFKVSLIGCQIPLEGA